MPGRRGGRAAGLGPRQTPLAGDASDDLQLVPVLEKRNSACAHMYAQTLKVRLRRLKPSARNRLPIRGFFLGSVPHSELHTLRHTLMRELLP